MFNQSWTQIVCFQILFAKKKHVQSEKRTSCEIVCRVFLSADQLLRVEQLAIGARAHLVHNRRFLRVSGNFGSLRVHWQSELLEGYSWAEVVQLQVNGRKFNLLPKIRCCFNLYLPNCCNSMLHSLVHPLDKVSSPACPPTVTAKKDVVIFPWQNDVIYTPHHIIHNHNSVCICFIQISAKLTWIMNLHLFSNASEKNVAWESKFAIPIPLAKGSKSTMTHLGTCFPAPVSEKNLVDSTTYHRLRMKNNPCCLLVVNWGSEWTES